MSKINPVDALYIEQIQKGHEYILYMLKELTDKPLPYKLRTTIFIEEEGGVHFIEHEGIVDTMLYEASYNEFLKKEIVKAAQGFVKNND
jgi:hypothetical protein